MDTKEDENIPFVEDALSEQEAREAINDAHMTPTEALQEKNDGGA